MLINEKNIYINKYFNSSEFKCPHCGEVIIDSDLIDVLTKIIEELELKSCIINSGYRCVYYDKQIGGFAGKHSQGKACDCKFKDKYNNYVESWKILCACESLFKEGGFALINDYSVHIDCRKKSIYRGDERISNNSVTNNFYNYFNKTTSDIFKSKIGENVSILFDKFNKSNKDKGIKNGECN